MNLPLRLPLQQLENQWATLINPVLNSPLLQGRLVEQALLNNGVTVINHGLGRKLIGWFIVGINAAATIYDSQSSNQTPQTTLVLNSNAKATVNLWVF